MTFFLHPSDSILELKQKVKPSLRPDPRTRTPTPHPQPGGPEGELSSKFESDVGTQGQVPMESNIRLTLTPLLSAFKTAKWNPTESREKGLLGGLRHVPRPDRASSS